MAQIYQTMSATIYVTLNCIKFTALMTICIILYHSLFIIFCLTIIAGVSSETIPNLFTMNTGNLIIVFLTTSYKLIYLYVLLHFLSGQIIETNKKMYLIVSDTSPFVFPTLLCFQITKSKRNIVG